jgi:hypothetical protein
MSTASEIEHFEQRPARHLTQRSLPEGTRLPRNPNRRANLLPVRPVAHILFKAIRHSRESKLVETTPVRNGHMGKGQAAASRPSALYGAPGFPSSRDNGLHHCDGRWSIHQGKGAGGAGAEIESATCRRREEGFVLTTKKRPGPPMWAMRRTVSGAAGAPPAGLA